jgi:hypothetical protein
MADQSPTPRKDVNMTRITIIRHITITAWNHRRGKDVGRLLELMPGQELQVRDREAGCFQLRQGWIDLPENAYREEVGEMTHYVKHREKGSKGWFFLTDDGGRTRLRIHAASFTEENARGLIADCLPDNPAWEFKIVPMS